MKLQYTLIVAAMLAALSASATAAADKRIVLRADTNREGRIDVTGATDEPGKAEATVYKGALVLANIDDDSGRCASMGQTEARQACFDAADEVINGDDDLLDMAELRTVPAPRAPKGATATIAIEGAGAANARLFVGQGMRADGYTLVTPQTVFTTEQLRQGLTFKLEAKTFARDLAVWDGTFTVALTAKRGTKSVTDRVKLRVAPLLTHTHAHTVYKLVTSTLPKEPQSKFFISDLGAALQPLGIPQQDLRVPGVPYGDQWTQDFFEPMYASVPTPTGVHGMQVLMRSEQWRQMQLGLFGFQGKDVAVGAITMTNRNKIKSSGFDSTGNLETIPRFGAYPAGRQILGGEVDGTGPAPAYEKFLAAQQMQTPLKLDTSWLLVGHVDEFISFLPANTPLGFRIAVADPVAATAAVRAAVDAGHGNEVYSTSPFAGFKTTLAQLLTRPEIVNATATASAKIEENLARVLQATGATQADVVRIPVLYREIPDYPMQDGAQGKAMSQMLAGLHPDDRAAYLQRRAAQGAPVKTKLGAMFPGAINWVVLDGKTLAVANQHAPLVNGEDFMQAAIKQVLAPLGYTPNWVEDFEIYHNASGEVHCGTNTLRQVPAAWWR